MPFGGLRSLLYFVFDCWWTSYLESNLIPCPWLWNAWIFVWNQLFSTRVFPASPIDTMDPSVWLMSNSLHLLTPQRTPWKNTMGLVSQIANIPWVILMRNANNAKMWKGEIMISISELIYTCRLVKGSMVGRSGNKQRNPMAIPSPCRLSWWRHQMENIFRITGHLCGELTGNRWIPAQRPVTRSFDVFLICARLNDWVKNHEAGDMRRYRVHHDVIVMWSSQNTRWFSQELGETFQATHTKVDKVFVAHPGP